MPADYLLSVDLGTSHTVAVVTWPDGRIRPLLFDGSPVMPSAVFLDEAGTIHVGRDAERLAATAPERFEPNPKQRVADGTLLLGDREIQVSAAFSAILTRVAHQCVEAVGGLPKAVLTCPAAWGEQRRASLHDAAAAAGYPPVRVVTEPVAAAHYYTGRLSHPIEPGQALAVFDFGGGTLDIAVVERRPDGTFGVLADGGLPDLGGLDFDAALVAHIGQTVAAKDPDLWTRLEQPTTTTDMRDRRNLWNDVRGAKEMLSRSSVAPVTVPGLEQSLHLTRGELDELSRPLLSRAVGETQRVLALTGRRSDELAGLFLVGGSSRMPQVGKILHEQLGIAPTALEQPELPVSEGATLAVAQPESTSPPNGFAPPAPSPQQTAAHAGPPPQDSTLQLRSPAAASRKSKRNKLIALIAGIAVIAIAVPLAWMWFTNPYKQRDFEDFTEVGDTIAFEAEPNEDVFAVRTWGDRAMFAYTADNNGYDEEELRVMAVDLAAGTALWDEERVFDGDGWGESFRASEGLMALLQEDTDGDSGYTWHFLDWESGEERSTVTAPSTGNALWGDHLVFAENGAQTITAYDAGGSKHREWKVGDEDNEILDWDMVGSADDLVEPTSQVGSNGLAWALTEDGVVHVYDMEEDEEIASEAVESTEDEYFGFDDKLYVAKPETNGYWINVYDLEDGLASVDQERVRDEEVTSTSLTPCGEQRVCVEEERGIDDMDMTSTSTYRVYDADDEEVAHVFDEFSYSSIDVVGDRLLARYAEGESDDATSRTQVFDKDFDAVGESKVESFEGIDGGSAISYPEASTFGVGSGDVVGLGARDGSRHLLEADLETYVCRPTDSRLGCFVEEGIQIYGFRDL